MFSVRAQPPQHTAITVWTWANTNKQTNKQTKILNSLLSVSILFIRLRQVKLTGGGVMFSRCPSVRLLQNLWTRHLNTSESVFMPIGTSGPRAWNGQLWRSEGQRSRSHEPGGLAEASVSTLLCRVAFLVLLRFLVFDLMRWTINLARLNRKCFSVSFRRLFDFEWPWMPLNRHSKSQRLQIDPQVNNNG